MNNLSGTIEDRAKMVAQALLDWSKTIAAEELFPVMVPEAAEIVATDPYAFSIATCLDRGTLADIIWTIPFDIKNKLGHLDPYRIYEMSLEELLAIFKSLPRRPRYVSDAPKTLRDLTRIVVEECGGDASKIWVGKRAMEVKRTFMSIFGVGEGIANMAVLLIEQAFPIHFNELDRPRMDIKPDVHTKRVLYRLGMSEGEDETAAVAAARRMNPGWPGALDGALWWIGRNRCRPANPNCQECPMDTVCAKKITGITPALHMFTKDFPGHPMKIVLIPCSGSKVPGGQAESLPSKLADVLSPAAFQKLMRARQEISDILREAKSQNGFKDDNGEPKYLPAYKRYHGLIYANSGISRLYPAFRGRLVIVSAMYGLLDGNDLIRDYELNMQDILPTGMKVHNFWKRHGLRDILLELLGGDGTAEVHDLLSGHYREALRPWPEAGLMNYRSYEYPGMGQGSSYGRAKDLKCLLEGSDDKPMSQDSREISGHEAHVIMDSRDIPKKENRMTGKYAPLGTYLTGLPASQRDVTLSFEHVEQILHDQLPPSASKHRAWWSNEMDGTHIHAHSWMDAGWKVDTVNLNQKWVRFLRMI